MAIQVVLVTVQSFRVPCKVEGAFRETVGIHEIHTLQPDGQAALSLNFPNSFYEGYAQTQHSITLPEHLTQRLMTFARKHLLIGPAGYDCASFVRFVLSWGPSESDDSYYHPGIKTSARELQPYQPYIFMRGEEKKHIVLALPNGYCLSIFGYDSNLIVAETIELMQAYGAETVCELAAVTA